MELGESAFFHGDQPGVKAAAQGAVPKCQLPPPPDPADAC